MVSCCASEPEQQCSSIKVPFVICVCRSCDCVTQQVVGHSCALPQLALAWLGAHTTGSLPFIWAKPTCN